jgi:anti-sigma factor RsiW
MINCPDLQEDVSLWVDGELDLTRPETVKRHLECCPECAAFHRDMNAIRQGVERLEPIEPPDRLWKSIRFQLEAEGLIRSEPKESFWAAILPKRLPGLKPAWSGAILALFLGIGSLLVYDLTTRSPVVPIPVASTSHQEAVLEELRRAEANYRAAIEALSASSRKKLESLDPVLAQVFHDNLATMDYYLNECKRAVENSPQNPLAQRYLLAAYQKKVELMQTIVTSDSLL